MMPKMKIAVLDVGHGAFTYSETPMGDNLVIDLGKGAVIPSVFLKRIPAISELQISHPHADHFDDIVEISKKKIKSFRCPELKRFDNNAMNSKNGNEEKIAKLKHLQRTVPADNRAVRVGKGFNHSLWAQAEANIDYSDANTASIVTTLSYKGVKFLNGGDLPERGWENLLEDPNFVSTISGTTIFQVPHHGRREGICQAIFDLDKFSPMLCIISDKAVEGQNEDTAFTEWYTERSKGCKIVGYHEPRKVLTTRADGSIFIEVNEKGQWWIYPNTEWRN